MPPVPDSNDARPAGDPTADEVTRAWIAAGHLVPERVSLSPVLEVSQRPNPWQRVKHLWQYRELLVNLTRKELKVKYKNSVLGFIWSLLNPLMYLIVFSFVFQLVLQTKVPYYGIFFLSGLLAWNFFNAGVMGGTASIVGNAQLVTKVWFPREALVLASVGAALVHFFLQSIVLLGALLVFRRAPSITYLPALLLAMLVLLVFTSALAVALSAINVYLRDTQHLMEVVLLAWFWMSAIAYPYRLVADRLSKHLGGRGEWLIMFNPILPVIITFQRVIYNPDHFRPTDALPNHSLAWFSIALGVQLVFSAALFYGALVLFSRLEDNFAEEI